MGIENVKRWQWVLIGALAGSALAFMNASAEPGAGLRSLSAAEFEREIALKEVPGDQPNLRKVTVHPPLIGAYDKPVYVVTMDRAVYDRKEKGWRYQPYALQAEVPYVSGPPRSGAAPAVDTNRTVLTALTEMAAKNPAVKFRYAWWQETRWAYALWMVGSVVAIGGIWPTIVNLLIGAGLGPKPKEKEYDLKRFERPAGAAAEDDALGGKPAPKVMSDEERDQLAAQLDKLEKSVNPGSLLTDVPAPVQGQKQGPTPVRQLSGGPVEIQAPLSKEDEDKEYKGEFYPVAIPTHQKHGDH